MVDAYGILNVTRFLQSFEARDIENAGEREGEREREREREKKIQKAALYFWPLSQ